jgi:hypothetical protein
MSAEGSSSRDDLLRMTNSFQMSQAIHVAATLGIADLLAEGPRTADELAEATGTHAPTLYRLLRALASVGVFAETADAVFVMTPPAEHLRTDVRGSVRDWAIYIGREYYWSSWGRLLGSVETGEPAFPALYGSNVWEYRAVRPEEDTLFNAAMKGLSAGVVRAAARSYDFSKAGVLVDVGGGDGTFLAVILAANPGLRGILLDQPHVVASAGPVLERAGVESRCEIIGGSFFDVMPEGADAYLLKSVVHDWDDPTAMDLLRICRGAMAATGRVLVVEPIIRQGNEPDRARFSDLNMLVMLGGRERTEEDFRELYAGAGLRLTNIIDTGTAFKIIEGRPA